MSLKNSSTENIKKQTSHNKKNGNIFLSIVVGITISILCIVVLSMISSALALKFKNPINLSKVIAFVCVILGGIICGLISAIMYNPNPLLSSTLSSISIAIILLFSNIMSNTTSVMNLILFPMIIFLSGLISGFLYSKSSKNRKTKKYLKM